MKRYVCLLFALGLLGGLPQKAMGFEVTAVFWPEFLFVDPTGPNPNSVALFQLTGLTEDADVTVTMTLTTDGTSIDELIYGSTELVFTATAEDGVVTVVRELPESTSPGGYTETVTVEQGGNTVSHDQGVTVKSTEDSEVAKVLIVPSGASKLLAYMTKAALASGSDVSSGGSPEGPITVYIPEIPRTIEFSVSNDKLGKFTGHEPNNFIGGNFGQFTVVVTEDMVIVLNAAEEVLASSGSPCGGAELILDPILNSVIGVSLNPNPANPRQQVSFEVSSGNNAGDIVVPIVPDPGTGHTPIGDPGGGCGENGGDGRILPYLKPAPAGFAYVNLTVYNLHGQQVKTLVDEARPFGRYTVEWDGRDEGGNEVASGLYIYRLQVGNQYAVGKGLILR